MIPAIALSSTMTLLAIGLGAFLWSEIDTRLMRRRMHVANIRHAIVETRLLELVTQRVEAELTHDGEPLRLN